MAEKKKYDVVVHFKSGHHKWTTKRKTVLAENIFVALEKTLDEERRPWRWDLHGKAKPADQFQVGW